MGELAFKVVMEAAKVVAADHEACPDRDEHHRPRQCDGMDKCWMRVNQPGEGKQRFAAAEMQRG